MSESKPAKVVSFGEIMLRLSTRGHERFVQAAAFDATFGGGEANVATSLANYGLDAHFVSAVPDNAIGQSAINHLRRFGVATDNIARTGDRLGIYFLEVGASQRPSVVVYDRAHSAISTIPAEAIDWKDILTDAHWFHWTGITPALGPAPRRELVKALEAAKSQGTTVSCDLNFRKKLWNESEAQETMRPFMRFVDVCIANEEDAQKCLGFKLDNTSVDEGDLDESDYFTLASALKKEFGFSIVAITLRESFSASRNGWSAILLDDAACSSGKRSNRYDITIVDRVGGGDAFASGLIFGLISKADSAEALEFAVAASCLKQTIPGDFNHVNETEVNQLMHGSGSGRVQR